MSPGDYPPFHQLLQPKDVVENLFEQLKVTGGIKPHRKKPLSPAIIRLPTSHRSIAYIVIEGGNDALH